MGDTLRRSQSPPRQADWPDCPGGAALARQTPPGHAAGRGDDGRALAFGSGFTILGGASLDVAK
jgi:hypothetical protein